METQIAQLERMRSMFVPTDTSVKSDKKDKKKKKKDKKESGGSD